MISDEERLISEERKKVIDVLRCVLCGQIALLLQEDIQDPPLLELQKERQQLIRMKGEAEKEAKKLQV